MKILDVVMRCSQSNQNIEMIEQYANADLFVPETATTAKETW